MYEHTHRNDRIYARAPAILCEREKKAEALNMKYWRQTDEEKWYVRNIRVIHEYLHASFKHVILFNLDSMRFLPTERTERKRGKHKIQ